MRAPGDAGGAWALVIGDEGLAHLKQPHGDAWTGLLRAHRQLVRLLETGLQERHGLSLSALEMLGRLAAAERRLMRIARLAEHAELSLSRASRILDALERRELLAREPCPEDSRATNVRLTEAGLELARTAQTDHLADVQQLFFDPLTERQVGLLAVAFARLTPSAPSRAP